MSDLEWGGSIERFIERLQENKQGIENRIPELTQSRNVASENLHVSILLRRTIKERLKQSRYASKEQELLRLLEASESDVQEMQHLHNAQDSEIRQFKEAIKLIDVNIRKLENRKNEKQLEGELKSLESGSKSSTPKPDYFDDMKRSIDHLNYTIDALLELEGQ